MTVAFILKLDLPSDDPTELDSISSQISDHLDSFDVLSCIPWSRDATQVVSQLMGTPAQPTLPSAPTL